MRIATFNILNGRSPGDGEVDVARFADAVRSIDADLLALQEVDRNQPRSGHADLTTVAAEAMGAVEHRFLPALTGTPGVWVPATGDEPADAPAYGVALLSRYPVQGWAEVRLPALPLSVPYGWRDGSLEWVRDEQRVGLVAEVLTPAGRLDVATTHLSFLPWWNVRQLRVLLRSLDALDPMVLLGDLNMGPVRARSVTGLRSLADGPTYPSRRPREQLDHVLVRGDIGRGSGGPLRLPISDHCALVADVALD
ncbi:MAG: endonuclease [Nocardioidaceae bacterium]|nr:endonuclease [Nocardioidaceae bacterium]